MNWEAVATIIGAILGGQTIVELIKVWRNRKTDARIEDAHADSEEFNTLRELCNFLQDQLKGKEERFAEQTQLVRNLNAEVIQLTKEKATVELDFEKYKAKTELELERVRCEDKPCPWRRPPNAGTEPKPAGLTKEQYHQLKDQQENGNS